VAKARFMGALNRARSSGPWRFWGDVQPNGQSAVGAKPIQAALFALTLLRDGCRQKERAGFRRPFLFKRALRSGLEFTA
jgi:hypothetical protein